MTGSSARNSPRDPPAARREEPSPSPQAARPRPHHSGRVVGAGDLQRSLLRDLSLVGVVTLSVLLTWSGVNTYYGAYSGGLAWVSAARSSALLSNERDLRAFAARADQLDAHPLAPKHLLPKERWVCRAPGGLSGAEGLREQLKGAAVAWLDALGDPPQEGAALSGFLWAGEQEGAGAGAGAGAGEGAGAGAGEGSGEGAGIWAAAAALHTVSGERCALLSPLDSSWLNFVGQLSAVEVALLSPSGRVLAHTLSPLPPSALGEGAAGAPPLQIISPSPPLSPVWEPRYSTLELSAPYGGPYVDAQGEERFGRFHVGERRFEVFHVALELKDPLGGPAGALCLILPEDVLLLWPKRGVLGTLLLGALLIGLTLWRTRARVNAHLSPLTQLVLDLEAFSVSIGAPPTLRERGDTPFYDINHLRRVLDQLKRQLEERERLEEQLRQAQKMEAVGVLAGGVAHDFNNLLSVIVLNAEALTDDLEARTRGGAGEELGPLIEMTREVSLACEQAKSLTRQLLSLSKDRGGKQVPFEMGAGVADTIRLMRRLLPETITLTLHAERSPLWVDGNASALQQALMNLLINARDAIESAGGAQGALEVSLYAHSAREARSLTAGLLRPERYVALSVKDSGTGISPEHLSKLFDPFFSTKGARGTGLGLAVIYTTVVQHMRGAISVNSTLGEGTEITLYLPRRSSGQSTLELSIPRELTPGTALCVALIEDHEQVRRALTLSLEKLGVTVHPFSGGAEFSEWFESPDRPRVHVVVSDVVMPNESGPEVWVRARLHDPTVPFLFLTGYADEALSRHRVPADRVLSKPVTGEELYAKLSSLLGAPARG